METGTLPANQTVTFYATASVYWLKEKKTQTVLVGIVPIIGDDPLSDDDVRLLAIRNDRERWNSEEMGPYQQAKIIGFGTARLIENRG